MLPARRKSKARKRARRSHHALRPVNLTSCPRCATAKLPHRACASCGYVNAKTSLKIEAKKEK